MRTISHFINGQSVTRPGAITSPVYDPNTGQVQALLEHGDAAILAETVAAAKAAQPARPPRSQPPGSGLTTPKPANAAISA